MKLALWQVNPTNSRIEALFDALDGQMKAASAAGAKLLVVPELVLPGYNRPDLHRELAQELQGEWMSRLHDMSKAAACGLCLGWAERDGEAVYNSATTIGPDGQILAHYRKIQLYGPMERSSFQPGRDLCPIFTIEGIKAAMLVCYDIEFPQHAAALAGQGAQLILVPTANPAGFDHVQRVLVPARAHENRAVVAYANFTGSEAGLIYGGRSVIAGPDGDVMAQAGALNEALLVVDLAATALIPESGWAAPHGAYRSPD